MGHTGLPEVLLAKTPKNPSHPEGPDTLVGHTASVLAAARAILKATSGRAIESMGLPSDLLPDLWDAVLRGSVLHDLGKANHQFQKIVRYWSRAPQALRHEWISTWLAMSVPELDEWLFSGVGQHVRWAALFSALGHHLKVGNGTPIADREGSGDTKVEVLLDHHDVSECLKLAAGDLSLCEPPPLRRQIVDLLDRPLQELLDKLVDAKRWHGNVGPEIQRYVALVKALVVAADVAGSAVPRQGVDPGDWAKDVLSRCCTTEELQEIARVRLNDQTPREFQNTVSKSTAAVSFVRAGCGSGKTVAAYLWAAHRAAGRKLFFCYPTTGTATEGFRDYVVPAEMAPASALLHSRAECDLEDVRGTQHEDLEETLEHIVRIESLAAWDMPLVICTVDQVLGLIQNNRRALFSIPSIANGAFVFDEIHQYDDRVFRALLRFLEAFPGAPTLLMTASLPAARLEAIRSKLRQLGSDLRVIEGPVELENVKRYLVEPPQEEPPWTAVKETLFRGGKVLWVANTVARCVAFAQAAEEKGLCPLAYHSRYRYCDRAEKHKDVVNAFRSSEAALAITTQVCEVSLDLSADLLVSDLAPTPSLIQRMGRLNRRASPNGTEQPKPLIVLEPPRATPYEDAEMEQARAWLSELGYGPLSQADLSRAFEEMAKDDVPGGIKSAWLDGGPFAAGGALHEASYSIPVVRREDEPRCLDERNRPVAREVTRYAVPMLLGPVSREIGGWKRLGFAFVAPEGRIDYSTQWGAKWAQT